MTERADEHLSAEDVARFLDVCCGSALLALEPLERHLRSCPECRGRVVETRLLETRLRRAFTREPAPVGDAEVLRARGLWSAATVPVLLPLPHATATGTSAPLAASAAPPTRRGTVARWVAAWRRAAGFVVGSMPLPLRAVVAGGVVLLLVLLAARATSPLRDETGFPVATPGVVVTAPPVGSLPPSAAVESTLAPSARVRMRRGAPDDASAPALRDRAPAPPPRATGRRRAVARDGHERLAAIGDQLPPPLRAAFLGCVVGTERPDRSCASTIARAHAVVHRARPAVTWPPESAANVPDDAADVWVSVWDELHRRASFDATPRR